MPTVPIYQPQVAPTTSGGASLPSVSVPQARTISPRMAIPNAIAGLATAVSGAFSTVAEGDLRQKTQEAQERVTAKNKAEAEAERVAREAEELSRNSKILSARIATTTKLDALSSQFQALNPREAAQEPFQKLYLSLAESAISENRKQFQNDPKALLLYDTMVSSEQRNYAGNIAKLSLHHQDAIKTDDARADLELTTKNIRKTARETGDIVKIMQDVAGYQARYRAWFPGKEAEAIKIGRGLVIDAAQEAVTTQDPGRARQFLGVFKGKGALAGLIEGEDLLHLENVIESKEREAKAQNAQEASSIIETLRDSVAAAADTGNVIPGTQGMISRLSSLGYSKEAAAISREIRESQKVWSAVDAIKDMPFNAQSAAIETLNPGGSGKVPGKGYVSQQRVYEIGKGVVQSRARAFNADPAGYANAVVSGRALESGVTLSAQQLADASKKYQLQMGAPVAHVLDETTVKNLRTKYDAATPREKLGIVRGIQTQYQKDAQGVLRDLKLGPAETWFLSLTDINASLGLEALSNKENIAGATGDKEALKKNFNNTFFSSSGVGTVLNRLGKVTGNIAYNNMAAALSEAGTKLSWMRGDAGDAYQIIAGTTNDGQKIKTINEKDVVGWFPADMPESAVVDTLRAKKAIAAIEATKGMKIKMDATNKARPKDQKLSKDRVDLFVRAYGDGIRNNSVWIPINVADGGGGFELHNGGTGRPVMGSDSKPIRITMDELGGAVNSRTMNLQGASLEGF